MIKSKGWDWKIVKGDKANIWKNPSVESYYLLNRWKEQEKEVFLDLGCGLGRHSILFASNGFTVYSFDISEEAIKRTKECAENEGLTLNYQVGDMVELPYENEMFDAIYCRNVISHTDTEGIKKIIKEIYRVLKHDGECYLTLGSKDSTDYKNPNWPMVDENTKLRMEEGPEYQVPHFYADYKLSKELFKDFEIIDIHQKISYFEKETGIKESGHYHILIHKK